MHRPYNEIIVTLINTSGTETWSAGGSLRDGYTIDLVPSDVKEGDNAPTGFALAQNYPNPFNPSTVIRYAIPMEGPVALTVYDMTGRKVSTLVNENKSAGEYQVRFDIGSRKGGQDVGSGIYFYRLTAGDFSKAKKLLLLK